MGRRLRGSLTGPGASASGLFGKFTGFDASPEAVDFIGQDEFAAFHVMGHHFPVATIAIARRPRQADLLTPEREFHPARVKLVGAIIHSYYCIGFQPAVFKELSLLFVKTYIGMLESKGRERRQETVKRGTASAVPTSLWSGNLPSCAVKTILGPLARIGIAKLVDDGVKKRLSLFVLGQIGTMGFLELGF